jgi:N-acetylneuraminic acid mutarotase
LDGLLYVAGGELPSTGPPDQITDSMITYDPTTMTWTPVISMPTKRTRFRLVAARGQLYAIGGFSEADQPLATVERYDPGSHSWDTVASMHQTRVLPGAVVIRSGQRRFIVVVGGGEGQPGTPAFRRLRTTEVYNVDTDRWHRLQVLLPHGKISLVSEVEDDRTVLAIGGGVAANGNGVASASVEALALTDHDLGEH